jgi:hypothetical protein
MSRVTEAGMGEAAQEDVQCVEQRAVGELRNALERAAQGGGRDAPVARRVPGSAGP